MTGKGLTVPLKTILTVDAEELRNAVKTATEGISIVGSVLSQDHSSMDAYLKRKAYDAEMERSGDADLAEKAAEGAGFSDKDMDLLSNLKDLSDSMKSFGESLIGFVQGMFGVVEDIYKQMRKSSPMLEMIENLFNLAMQLFFMPLGNKLAEVMLPAIINMMDAVIDIWDKFDNKSLGVMFSIAITEGVRLIAEYLTDLGSLLEDEGGIVGSIGSLLISIGEFIEKDGERLIEFGVKIFEFLMNNVGTLIVAALEFFMASIAIQVGISTMLATYFSMGILREVPGAGAAAAGAGLAAGAATIAAGNVALFGSGLGGDLLGFDDSDRKYYTLNKADGGFIPATPGGQILRVAEGGEGEYIVPESKVNSFITEMRSGDVLNDMSTRSVGHNNITNNFYIEGLTTDELKTFIRDEINEMVSQSRYRGGF